MSTNAKAQGLFDPKIIRGAALDIETAVVHPIGNLAPDAEPEQPGIALR